MTTMIGTHPVIAGRWPIDPSLPALVFVHGAALSKSLWQFQIADLADVANTIALDLPGHGKSSAKASDRIADYADAVMDLIGLVGAEKTILCGLSMGGAVALDILIRHPQAASAAICMHTGARLKVLPMIFETIETNYQQYIELMPQFAFSPDTDKTQMIPLLSSMVSPDYEVALKAFHACNNFDVMDEVSRIHKPVLVMTGEKDMLTPSKYAQFLHSRIAGSSMLSIPGAGHLSPIEQNQAVSDAIRAFLSVLQGT